MTIRKTISLTNVVYQHASQRITDMGFNDFSSYVAALIRADSGNAPITRPAASEPLRETPPPYGNPPPPPTPSTPTPPATRRKPRARGHVE